MVSDKVGRCICYIAVHHGIGGQGAGWVFPGFVLTAEPGDTIVHHVPTMNIQQFSFLQKVGVVRIAEYGNDQAVDFVRIGKPPIFHHL